jgi:hypothetical protein
MNLLKLDYMHDMRREEIANKFGELWASLTGEQAGGKIWAWKTLPTVGAEK